MLKGCRRQVFQSQAATESSQLPNAVSRGIFEWECFSGCCVLLRAPEYNRKNVNKGMSAARAEKAVYMPAGCRMQALLLSVVPSKQRRLTCGHQWHKGH
jgi:hypothetical protein